MWSPGLTEMLAGERMLEAQRADRRRPVRRSSTPAAVERLRQPARPAEGARLARSQRAFGWFLVSVGLRLALPRAGASTAR